MHNLTTWRPARSGELGGRGIASTIGSRLTDMHAAAAPWPALRARASRPGLGGGRWLDSLAKDVKSQIAENTSEDKMVAFLQVHDGV